MDAAKKKVFFLYLTEFFSLFAFLLFSISLEFIPPNMRIPDLSDKSISFPFTEYEIVSALMLPMFNVIIPTIVILSVASINRFKNRRIFVALLGLFFTVSLSFLITNVFKSPVGRLRPDFISRCKPNPESSPVLCTGDAKLVTEGRRSFPSGHSSSSFGGLGFISLFLSDHFLLLNGSGRIYKFLIFLTPLLTACLVSLSRIVDYRYHWDDVLVGSLIGCLSAAAGYYYFYPLLFRTNAINQTEQENTCNQLDIKTSSCSV